MNRREFVQRMLAAGLVLPTTKTIFDMGKNLAGKVKWEDPCDPYDRTHGPIYYDKRRWEQIIIHGKYPFKIYYNPEHTTTVWFQTESAISV